MASVDSLFACELLEIRLSTVIVHCVETSVIVNQNVLRDFSTQELKKMAEQTKKKKEWKKKTTKTRQHERAFIVLCIYAIVYVSLWRIWKYMLTNLYRVFYVMWNTWSRCSLVSRSLDFFLFVSVLSFLLLFFFPLSFKTTYQKDKLIAHPKPKLHSRDTGLGDKDKSKLY